MLQFRQTYTTRQTNEEPGLKRLFQWLVAYQHSNFAPPPEIQPLVQKYLPGWTVKKGVQVVFENYRERFSLLELISSVRTILGRPSLTDGTITRRLRELRDEGTCCYKVIDTHKSIYQKEKPKITVEECEKFHNSQHVFG